MKQLAYHLLRINADTELCGEPPGCEGKRVCETRDFEVYWTIVLKKLHLQI